MGWIFLKEDPMIYIPKDNEANQVKFENKEIVSIADGWYIAALILPNVEAAALQQITIVLEQED